MASYSKPEVQCNKLSAFRKENLAGERLQKGFESRGFTESRGFKWRIYCQALQPYTSTTEDMKK